MIIELASLPPIVQSYVQQGQSVEIKMVDNQVIATPKAQKIERSFNFDLQRIEQSINSGRIEVPNFKNTDEFLAWVNS